MNTITNCQCVEQSTAVNLTALDRDSLALLSDAIDDLLAGITVDDADTSGELHEVALHVPLGALQLAVNAALTVGAQ